MHGAAVAENADDSEGELIARIRAVVGPKLPIVASLDLHANGTERMLQLADGLALLFLSVAAPLAPPLEWP